jgi:hypothetical protein
MLNRDRSHLERTVRKRVATGAAVAILALPFAAAATAVPAAAAVPRVDVLHTLGHAQGGELTNLVAVDSSGLLPLLPPGYNPVPASALQVGSPTQGILVIVNFRGTAPTVDDRPTGVPNQVDIDVGILVGPPVGATGAGLDIPGAFHLYALQIVTNDPTYKDALLSAHMPGKFVKDVTYESTVDDATGFGNLMVSVPAKRPVLKTVNTGQGYALMPGALDAIFWHEGPRGTSALHFRNEPFQRGQGIGRVYTQPSSMLQVLLDGGGLGPCPPDEATGNSCVIAPAANFRYGSGGRGELLLIR